MADAIRRETAELHLAEFAPATAASLQETLVKYRLEGLVDVKNPLDVTPMATDAAFADLIRTMLDDGGVDLLVAGVVPLTPAMQTLPPGPAHRESLDSPQSIARLLPEIAAVQTKPVAAVLDAGEWFDPLAQRLEQGGVPVFRAADRAVRVLCKYVDVKVRNARRTQ
jgi:acyl-CoA synthetase (NDP forming)